MIKKANYERLLLRMLEQLNKHTHSVELLNIMEEQVFDDTFYVRKSK